MGAEILMMRCNNYILNNCAHLLEVTNILGDDGARPLQRGEWLTP